MLTCLGVLVGLLLIVEIFMAMVVSEIPDLIDFIVAVVQDPNEVTEYLRTVLEHSSGSVSRSMR